ncbi:rhodanese-like domain-containing protein [Nocardioides speluncae]|uniref:rhodanese-like domain-containing protein n=1 Tax=Nocardioides speluncae TaxID=2670337 RepID=UPI001F0C5541|nr:rhodanese-like domain-containing protein [Nocardioides speluncae]
MSPIYTDAVYFDGIDAMLDDARSRLRRVSARTAYQEALWDRSVLLVDIRPAAQRAAEGELHEVMRPLVIERNVLEWRLDPRSSAKIPQAAYDARVIVVCQEGYTSSLAADALVRLGVSRATDLVGGFAAWRQAGLPISSAVTAPDLRSAHQPARLAQA